jgi:hypothetical protein
MAGPPSHEAQPSYANCCPRDATDYVSIRRNSPTFNPQCGVQRGAVFALTQKTLLYQLDMEVSWRMGWDSNPRRACTLAGFQDRCLKPLGHPSLLRLRQRSLPHAAGRRQASVRGDRAALFRAATIGEARRDQASTRHDRRAGEALVRVHFTPAEGQAYGQVIGIAKREQPSTPRGKGLEEPRQPKRTAQLLAQPRFLVWLPETVNFRPSSDTGC